MATLWDRSRRAVGDGVAWANGGAAENGGRVELDACACASERRKTPLTGGPELAVAPGERASVWFEPARLADSVGSSQSTPFDHD